MKSVDIENKSIIKDAYFGKLGDVSPHYDTTLEFIHEFIHNEPNKCFLLNELSNLYVIIATTNTMEYNDHATKWNDILDDKQFNILKKNGEYIVGYMCINKFYNKNKDVHYINLINTRVKNYNFAKIMMNKYTSMHNISYVVPIEIIQSSCEYWKKIFFDMFDVKTLGELEQFIDIMEIDKKIINYKYLHNLLA